ncbi:MAG: hypothetical protein NVSMB32_00810 [Actinomycetota bacterium]
MGHLTEAILQLHGWVALAIIFAVPALEASAFLGFLFPGEIAVLLGGVLAYQGRVPLWAAMLAAASGAVVGDSAGYFIGRRWGRGLLHGTLGRLPIIRKHLDRHLDAAEAYVRRRKGSAVLFGRFTAALRVMVPGLAGIAGVHYPTFFAYNLVGGVVWGAGFVLLGYLGGASYHRVATIASRVGLLLLVLVVLGLVASRLTRSLREKDSALQRRLERLGAIPPLAWVRDRFPRQVAWVRARLDPTGPRGFGLTFSLAFAALAGWAFGGLTQDVVAHDEMFFVDPKVASWFVAHRVHWLTEAVRVVTWLGSLAVVMPLATALAGWFLLRRKDWRPLVMLGCALGGAIGTYVVVKQIIGRPRPAMSTWLGHFTGSSFPSGHATQVATFFAMAALVLSTGASTKRRVLVWGVAAAVILIVGLSRLYLGAHWLSDVMAGWAVGALWISLAAAVRLGAEQGDAGRAPGDLNRPAGPEAKQRAACEARSHRPTRGNAWIGGCFIGSTCSSNEPHGRAHLCVCTPRMALWCFRWPSSSPGGSLVEPVTSGGLPEPSGVVLRPWVPSSPINSSDTSCCALDPM